MSSTTIPAEAVGLVVGVLAYSVICLCTSLLLYIALITLREYTNCMLCSLSIAVEHAKIPLRRSFIKSLIQADRRYVIGRVHLNLDSGVCFATD